MDATKELLNAQEEIIRQQQQKIVLLEELAEQRRLAYMHQCRELAEHREFDAAIKHPWLFFWWLLLKDVWPFSHWYHRFDGGVR